MKNSQLYSLLSQLNLEEKVIFKDNDAYSFEFHKDIKQRIEAIAPDAVYVFNSQPLILFFDLANRDANFDLDSLYKKVWSFDSTSIIFIIKDSGIEVFNALHYIKSKSLNSLEKIDLSHEEIVNLFNLWELESGKTWEWFQNEFIYKKRGRNHSKRVNERLFSNIKQVREDLKSRNLSENEANSLILRLIFIRYLIDRKIKIDDELIIGEVENLNERRKSFIELIREPQKLNKLFEKLNSRFNGVLFKENDILLDESQANYLSDVFSGELQDENSLFNGFFFEIFDFSIIPVEVISGIYESLIDEEKRKLDSAVYTPSFLVDYILKDTVDEFLMTNKPEECTVFEVAVGSGIFLVQSLRRIIEKEIEINGQCDNESFAKKIRGFAENNLYGIDINEQALKVTCFSIYIALLDYLEPADINVYPFPELIGKNLFEANFFDTQHIFNDVMGLVHPKFILGNPPWKKDKSEHHLNWVNTTKTYSKKIVDGLEIAQSFLIRAKEFMVLDTVCSLIVTSTIFYNVSKTTKEFKIDFLTSFKLKKFFDLSPVRRLIFEKNNSPATIVNFMLSQNSDYKLNVVNHQSIKSNIFLKNFKILVVEKFDKKEIIQKEFIENEWMFKVALYGNTLDYYFLKRLVSNSSLKDFWGERLRSLDGFKRDKISKYKIKDIDRFITEKSDVKNYYTPSKKDLEDREDLSVIYSNFGDYRIILKGQTKNESEIIVSFSEGKAIFRNDTFLFVSKLDVIKVIYSYLISDIYTYFQYITSSTWGIATRPAIRMYEYLNFPFVEINEEDKKELIVLIDAFLRKLKGNNFDNGDIVEGELFSLDYLEFEEFQKLFNSINNLINKVYGVKENERDLIDYVLNVSRYQFQESKQFCFTKNVGDDKQFLSGYAEVYLKEFSDIYSDEYIQVEIFSLEHFIAMNFVMKAEEPKDKIIYSDNKDVAKVLQTLADTLSISQVVSSSDPSKNLFVQKDIKGFEENSFYIIKPNEYKSWHRAMAWYDVAEFKEAIQKAEIDELNNDFE
ncbi:type I endonuclease-methyltransferase fusion protein [Neptunitalea chrysea]|uniref:site-specific DNA-methyltransferase (adenine-specific) n=1 Tax=Neptunitalea chrysea TaxID=1647581 RepID=A0A9W6ETY7_9FLAO|nr:DNA methyltransferase [Neptunitalea chrysea]GLB52775.1 type I endonuclease-methyltransferase fusion protein [Neptunitalea chrysea]